MPPVKTSKKSKRPDGRPSRKKYWASRHLEQNKVKNLMRHCGMTRANALVFWRKVRTTRIPANYIFRIETNKE